MSDKTELDIDAERASFEAAMNAARFFPAELCFAQTKSPSGRNVYANSHLESCWVGWLAARRAAIQPTACEVGVFAGYVDGILPMVEWSGAKPAIGEKLYTAGVQPTAAEPVGYVSSETMSALERGISVMAAIVAKNGLTGVKEPLYRAPVAPADAVRDARDLALEEAEKACVGEGVEVLGEPDRAYNLAITHCVAALRALKSTPKEPAK